MNTFEFFLCVFFGTVLLVFAVCFLLIERDFRRRRNYIRRHGCAPEDTKPATRNPQPVTQPATMNPKTRKP